MPEPLFCAPCAKRGHTCIVGGTIEDFPDGVPKCAFCEDGIACPKTTERQFTEMTRFADVEMQSADPIQTPAKPRGICSVEGCNAKPGPKSTTGKCTHHARRAFGALSVNAAKRPRFTQGENAVNKQATAPDVRFCGECGKRLRKDCRSETCCACRLTAPGGNAETNKPSKKKAAPNKPVATDAQPEITDASVVTLCITEQQLDQMFLQWPLDRKVEVIQSYLAR